MDDTKREFRQWVEVTGNRTAQSVASALGISRSAADRALRGEAGESAMRRIQDRIGTVSRLNPSLGAAMEARVIVALSNLGHDVEQSRRPDAGIDFIVDGVAVQLKVFESDDHGRRFLEKLAGLRSKETKSELDSH
jgi:hypothetical protein